MQDNDPLLDNIINTTLQMAFSSSIIAFLFGTLIGLLVAFNDFPGKRIVVTFMRTLMGLPPVVVGIIVYVLFSGTGPFGNLGLIYSVKLMIIAQVVLITPIVAGMTETAISPIVKNALPSLKGMGANPFKRVFLIIGESKYQLIAVYLLFADFADRRGGRRFISCSARCISCGKIPYSRITKPRTRGAGLLRCKSMGACCAAE